MIDLHIIMPSGNACLCFIFDKDHYLPKGFNIPDFFHNLLVPFFYAQSYYENNNKWPWGEYEHGLFALFEWYAESRKQASIDMINECFNFIEFYKNKGYKPAEIIQSLFKQNHEIKGHQPCVCGSSIKFRNCHPRIFNGLWKLKKDIDLLKYNYH